MEQASWWCYHNFLWNKWFNTEWCSSAWNFVFNDYLGTTIKPDDRTATQRSHGSVLGSHTNFDSSATVETHQSTHPFQMCQAPPYFSEAFWPKRWRQKGEDKKDPFIYKLHSKINYRKIWEDKPDGVTKTEEERFFVSTGTKPGTKVSTSKLSTSTPLLYLFNISLVTGESWLFGMLYFTITNWLKSKILLR